MTKQEADTQKERIKEYERLEKKLNEYKNDRASTSTIINSSVTCSVRFVFDEDYPGVNLFSSMHGGVIRDMLISYLDSEIAAIEKRIAEL